MMLRTWVAQVSDNANDFHIISAADDIAERPVHGRRAGIFGDVQDHEHGALRNSPRSRRVGLLDTPGSGALHFDQAFQGHFLEEVLRVDEDTTA